jgi:type I protein arginine methyltransferase
MMADTIRMAAYEEALRRTVKPGSVVVDIGAGMGIMAFIACRFGAARVYAIEPDDVIQIGRRIAADNGLSGRIEFIQNLSTRVELPERADVIVSDVRGVLPFLARHFETIADARKRLLADSGVLIPSQDRVWAMLVEMPDAYQRHVKPWGENDYGLNMAAASRILANTWIKKIAQREQVLVEPQLCETLDYYRAEAPDYDWSLKWTASRKGITHGLSVWFDTNLFEDVGFSNAPGQPELIYGNAFFPWSEPVELAVGDRIVVGLNANLIEDDYLWRWSIRIESPETGEARTSLNHSTFFGIPLSPKQLQKRASTYVPVLDNSGLVDRAALGLMDGNNTLADIAGSLRQRFPERFSNVKAALTHIGELSKKYSR